MHTKAPPPASRLAGQSAPALLHAYLETLQLKRLYRQGWLRVGVPRERCESVAEHSFGVATLVLFLSGKILDGIDPHKLLKMALVHDLGEARAGDITPHDGVSADDKHAQEREGVALIASKLPHGGDLLSLWEEYEAGVSPEARLVRQLDRLEMALQACAYELDGEGSMETFLRSAERVVDEPSLRELIDATRELRTAPAER